MPISGAPVSPQARIGVCEKIGSTQFVIAALEARVSGLICEPYQGVIPERRARAAYRGSMSKHVPVSLWIPGNCKGDFGNGGEDECKKNEPDRRALEAVIQRTRQDFNDLLDGRVKPGHDEEGDAEFFTHSPARRLELPQVSFARRAGGANNYSVRRADGSETWLS